MAAVCEEGERVVAFVKVPGADDDIFVEALPGTGEVAIDEVVVFIARFGVVEGIEHVGPDIYAAAGVDGSEDCYAFASIFGEYYAWRKVA